MLSVEGVILEEFGWILPSNNGINLKAAMLRSRFHQLLMSHFLSGHTYRRTLSFITP
jgi:hypothetical protein